MAWKYEKADVEMGGNGTANWNESQKQEILERGSVRGAEGHHQRNVAAHPEDQADPDNIKFYKSRKEHLEEGHHGDFHNESDAPPIDKEAKLEHTNRTRVIRNELKGAGIAAVIGLSLIHIWQPISEWFKEQWEKLRQGLRQSAEEPRKSRGFKL